MIFERKASGAGATAPKLQNLSRRMQLLNHYAIEAWDQIIVNRALSLCVICHGVITFEFWLVDGDLLVFDVWIRKPLLARITVVVSPVK